MRNSSEIAINRVNDIVKSVLITADSTRRWKLMEEDNITLSFVLDSPIDFQIGDYIQDELFGRFYITETPAPPEYNTSNGAYKYELRFDREYIGWKNIIFQMTRTQGGVTSRKETDWVLTDILENHIRELIRNLSVIGENYRYCIDGTNIYKYQNGSFNLNGEVSQTFTAPEELQSAKSISYKGTKIYDALKDGICKAYECEFWVVDDILCLGKCEIGSAIDFRIKPGDGDRSIFYGYNHQDFQDSEDRHIVVGRNTGGINVETMRPSRNSEDYANRLYVFGSTKNIPYSYRKKLEFTITESSVNGWRDGKRILYTPMVKGATEDRSVTPSFVYHQTIVDGERADSQNTALSNDIPVEPGENVEIVFNGQQIVEYLIYLYNGSSYVSIGSPVVGTYSFVVPSGYSAVIIHIPIAIASAGLYRVDIEGKNNVPIQLTYNGGTYSAKYYHESGEGWIYFDSSPSGWGIGSRFSIAESNLNVSAIKQSYYTSDYGDPSSLSHIGEQRLMVPLNGPQYIGDSTLPANRVVEKVVFFENIYPKCALRISDVKAITGMNTAETYDDGSSTRYSVTKYTIKAKRITESGDVAFPFDQSMILSGEKLQIKFLTREEETSYTSGGYYSSSDHALAGMTFDVKWNQTNKSFTIVWNQDYGAQLPNEVLAPQLNDSFILIGWNVKAMGELGIISSAEQLLYTSGQQYLDALNKFQYTFDCSMMSGWNNNILPFGQRVNVYTDAIPEGYYGSRVIGYELKLDIPEDTPIYTIGDTEAYSRLRSLEKSLQTQEGNVSTSGDSDTSYASDGSSSGDGMNMLEVWRSLTNDPGIEEYNDTTEIDINHIPMIPKERIDGDLDTFFELDSDHLVNDKPSVKLKDEYAGLWTPGFMTAGGVGSSSGGGGTNMLTVWRSLTNNEYLEVYNANTQIAAAHIPLASGGGIGVNGYGELYVTTVGGVSSVAELTGAITEAQLAQAIGIGSIENANPHLVTGGTVYSYINTVLSSAINFVGVSSTAITNGGTETPTINGSAYVQKKGDVVLYNGLEFLWNSSAWVQFGDESSYALKTISITGTGYLSGGGNLTENRTIDIADAVKTKIEHGESAYNRTNWDDYFGIDNSGNIYVKNNGNTHRGFWNEGFITAGGIGSSSGGGETNMLTVWRSLTNNEYLETYSTNTEIASAHIPWASMPTASTSTKGGVKVDGTTIAINNGVISATNGATGTVTGVKVGTNGSTISPDSNGVVTIPYYNLTAQGQLTIGNITVTPLYGVPIAQDTVIGGFKTGFSATGSNKDYALKLNSSYQGYVSVPWTDTTYKLQVNGSWNGDTTSGTNLGTIYAPTTTGTQGYVLAADANGKPAWTDISGTYLPTAGGNMTGDITFNHGKGIKFKNSSSQVKNGIIMSSNMLYVGGPDQVTAVSGQRLDLYYNSGTMGETLGMRIAQTTGRTTIYKGLSLNGTNADNTEAYIDFDSANHAFHIHGNIYADGFVTAGGIGGGNSLFVTIADTQTITGEKTFNANVTVGSSYTLTATTIASNKINPASGRFVQLASSNNASTQSNGNTVWIGLNPTNNANKLYVNGYAGGAYGWNQSSDRKLKENILSINPSIAIEKLMLLNPVTWTWNNLCCHEGDTCAGFVAQDVQDVIPQMVRNGGKFLSLDYSMLHAFEIAGMQNHEARIRELEKENAELKRRLCYES